MLAIIFLILAALPFACLAIEFFAGKVCESGSIEVSFDSSESWAFELESSLTTECAPAIEGCNVVRCYRGTPMRAAKLSASKDCESNVWFASGNVCSVLYRRSVLSCQVDLTQSRSWNLRSLVLKAA